MWGLSKGFSRLVVKTGGRFGGVGVMVGVEVMVAVGVGVSVATAINGLGVTPAVAVTPALLFFVQPVINKRAIQDCNQYSFFTKLTPGFFSADEGFGLFLANVTL